MKKLLISLIFCVSCSAFSQVPPNDVCENAIEIFCWETILGTNINATNDSSQAPDCQGITTETGVWYKLLSIDTNALAIVTCSELTDFDTKISVYTGDCSNLICLNSDDNNCFQSTASLVFLMEPFDFPFYILVHGANGAEGQFALTPECFLIGVDDNIIEGFEYSPVPAQDIINLSALDNIDSVAIYNLSGQRVISYSLGVSNISVDVSTLKAGMYIMKVLVGEQTGIYKIIKL